MQYSKSYGKWPEKYSSCTVIQPKNFKIFQSFLHGYHNPQPQDTLISPTISSPHNFKILPTLYIKFFWIGNLT